jgi:hypothetical protein
MDLENEPDEFEEIREHNRKEADRLSLELLSNTSHYKKYLAKNDPDTKQQNMRDIQRFHKHKSKIADLLSDLLDEYEDLGTVSVLANTDIQTIFKECVLKTMRFIEWRDCMDMAEEDGDMMFQSMDQSVDPLPELDTPSSSFWGKKIHKSNNSNLYSRRPTFR